MPRAYQGTNGRLCGLSVGGSRAPCRHLGPPPHHPGPFRAGARPHNGPRAPRLPLGRHRPAAPQAAVPPSPGRLRPPATPSLHLPRSQVQRSAVRPLFPALAALPPLHLAGRGSQQAGLLHKVTGRLPAGRARLLDPGGSSSSRSTLRPAATRSTSQVRQIPFVKVTN